MTEEVVPGAESETQEDLNILNDDKNPPAEPETEEEEELESKSDEASEEPESEEAEDSTQSETESEEETKDTYEYAARPQVQEVEKAFPGVFKKFPGLKDAYFAERKYREAFPTPEDAVEAAENAPKFAAFEQDIMSGNSGTLLSAIAKTDPEALGKFAENFLPQLLEKDEKSYVRATKPFLTGLLRQLKASGEASGDKNLRNAALVISKHLFNSIEIPIDRVTPTKDDPIKQERAKLQTERWNEFRGDVESEGDSQLLYEIAKDLDPENVLPSFVRESIIQRTQAEIVRTLTNDKAYLSLMNSIWAKSETLLGNRPALKEQKSRLIKAFLARARAAMKPIRQKYLAEAMGKINKSPKAESKRIPSSSGTPAKRSATVTVKEAREKHMSDEDILGIGAR